MITSQLTPAARLVDRAQRIVALTGAGISTAAGLPDFRGPQGLWTTDPRAERVSTLSYYLEDEDVRAEAWRRRADQARLDPQPTAAHRALVTLEQAGRLTSVVTQNTDGLHQDAGTPSELVLEVHGSARTTRCEDCGNEQPTRAVTARVSAGERDPRCRQPDWSGGECGGILRATVILFEEALDRSVLDAAVAAVERCDLLVAIGSTLSVQPVAGLIPYAIGHGASVVTINASPTQYDDLAHVALRGEIQTLVPALLG